ncbi:MAG: NAD(P)-dependent oxidoreductase [Acidimicrobiales bacterium]
MTTEVLTVGFIGLGRMGMPMATQLADRGFDLLVYNRSVEKAKDFAATSGASVPPGLRELGEASDVVVLMLADGPAVMAVLEGPDGLAAGLSAGDVVVDMGTTGIELTNAARQAVEAAGAALVEAPVSGSVAAVESRALLVMAAGDDTQIDRVMPVLEGITDRVVRVGGNGTGAAIKLAVNSVLYGINQAVAESLVMAERAGIDRSVAYDIFSNSAVGAPVVHYRKEVFEKPGTTPITFTAELAAKDLGLILELARSVGTGMPQATANLAVITDMIEAGAGLRDMGDVAVHLRGAE